MIVLFVVADSLRADAPSFAGGAADTPALDSLAAEGTWFADMFASGASTIPSMMSMITGSFPHNVGVGRWLHPFPAGRPNLMTAFAAAGFRVLCFQPYPQFGFLTVPATGEVMDSQDTEAIVSALTNAGAEDLFVVIHHWWTHLPYVNHALSGSMWHRACDFSLESLNRHPRQVAPKLRESYLKTVRFFSEELMGRYLDAASAGGRDVLLLVVGDHGENWGESLPQGRPVEHVYDLHGRWITDETIRVPFLVWGKSVEGPLVGLGGQDGFVQGVDLAPTIADLAGVAWPGPLPTVTAEEGGADRLIDRGLGPDGLGLDLAGRSLAKWITKGEASPANEVMTVTSHNAWVPGEYPSEGPRYWRALGLRTENRWVVWDGVERETMVRSLGSLRRAHSPDEIEAVRVRLEAERQRAVDCGPPARMPDGAVSPEEIDETVAARMRTLGYLE